MSEPARTAIAASGKGGQVFISYSRADRLSVDRLFRDLERGGFVLWMDVHEHGIEAGENWRTELQRQVSTSEAMIACLSPDFLKSPFCQAEIEQALKEGKAVYPVKLRRIDAADETEGLGRFGLSDTQYVDLSPTFEAYEIGLGRLRERLPKPRLISARRFIRLARALLQVLALLAVFVLGMFAAVRVLVSMTPPPSVAGRNIGVVVAPFSVPSDRRVDQDEADGLALRFANLLDQELAATTQELRLTYALLRPDQVAPIEGDLGAYAERYGADLVVYGQVSRDQAGQVIIEPRFWISPDTFVDALEITGASRFGAPLLLVSARAGGEQALSTRATSLAEVVIGLSRYLLRDYAGALRAVERAAASEDLAGQPGSEVVQTLIGSMRLKLASDRLGRGDFNASEALLTLSEEAYQAALAVSPEYARAYTGLSAVAYLRWNLGQQRGDPADLTALDSALTLLERGSEATTQPNLIYQTRAQLPRVQIQYARWLNNPVPFGTAEPESLVDLERTLTRILAVYEDGRPAALQGVAAEAYKYRGLVAYGQGDCLAALSAYAQAIPIAAPLDRMFLTGWTADCQAEIGQTELAVTSYRDALALAEAVGASPEVTERFQQRIDDLSGRG
jgi:tetratricopeptide (TPR) repeat protein